MPFVMFFSFERDLQKALRVDGDLSQKQRMQILSQIVDGMSYLHQDIGLGPIHHGDLRPVNVVLDQNNRARVTGFEFPSLNSIKESIEAEFSSVAFTNDILYKVTLITSLSAYFI